MWTNEDQLKKDLWIARWLVEHADELPDLSHLRRRPALQRKMRWRFANTAWGEMRAQQKKADRELLRCRNG